MSSVTAIKNYILFLKKEHLFSISLHPAVFDPIINSSELRVFNIHTSPYCTLIKTNKAAQEKCICMQKRVFEKCKNGSYCGTCYAGVKEFVYPITNGKENIGFISVSGYKTENAQSYHKKLSKEYGFNIKELKSCYGLLRAESITKEYADTLIHPLCDMLELAYLKNNSTVEDSTVFAQKVANYIREARNRNITSKDICKKFFCSRSYMSTEFNKYFGKTIREYITELRMEDAKALLVHSSLSITEIAYCVGFSDANYFSVLFKRLNNVTPSAYRKASKTL